MWCSTASTTTMASSTTMPIASTRASSEIVLIEKPNSGNSTKVPTSETGTASSGISVARQPWRKTKTTRITSTIASTSVVHDLVDALAHGERGVERDGVVEIGREALLQLLHQRAGLAHRLDRVRARRLVDGHDRGRLAVQAAHHVVDLRAELDARHVAHADHRAVGGRAHDDVAELLLADEPALGAHRVGELLAGRHRLAADLARRVHRVLLLDRRDDLRDGDAALGEHVGPHPEAHRVLSGAEDRDLPDAAHAPHRVGRC